jgi:hypothetical protein
MFRALHKKSDFNSGRALLPLVLMSWQGIRLFCLKPVLPLLTSSAGLGDNVETPEENWGTRSIRLIFD